jgi:hypothetical protein
VRFFARTNPVFVNSPGAPFSAAITKFGVRRSNVSTLNSVPLCKQRSTSANGQRPRGRAHERRADSDAGDLGHPALGRDGVAAFGDQPLDFLGKTVGESRCLMRLACEGRGRIERGGERAYQDVEILVRAAAQSGVHHPCEAPLAELTARNGAVELG